MLPTNRQVGPTGETLVEEPTPQASTYDIPIPPPINREQQDALVRKLKAEYDAFKNDIAPLHDNIKRWHGLYESSQRDQEKTWPWPGAANFSVPIIMATVDSIHARIIKAVFDIDPLWLAKARAPSYVDLSRTAELYLDYWADHMDLPSKLDPLTLNMLIEGVGIMKMDWGRTTTQIPQPQMQDGSTFGPTEVIEYDGPTGYHVPLRDFVLIPADSPTIEEAVYVGHRVHLTHEQLKNRARQGFYFNVDELLKNGTGDSTPDKTPYPSGIINTSGSSHSQYKETNQYEIFEFFCHYDFGDGDVPALVTASLEHDLILRAEPYPYQYGRAPYIDFQVYPRTNLFWGRSVPEMLESAQEELTAMHNMRADALAIRIAPPILARISSRWDPEEQPWAPGQIINVTDPAEIIQMQIADVPSSLFAHEQDTLAFVERVTGMSDYFMGRSPAQNRTATEVSKVTSEGLARMDVMVSRFQHGGMKSLSWVLWWLLYQYRPFVDYFQSDGQNYMITKTQMRPTDTGLMPFELIPHGMLSEASKEARRAQRLNLFQVASGPLSQFYPDGMQVMLKEIAHDFEIKNVDEMLGPPWSVIQKQLQQAFQQGMQQGAEQAQQQQTQEQNDG